jgi:hypothetical protein
MSSILAAGTVAPNFTLRVTPDQDLTLSDLGGKPVILAFYPADWSPVCGDQMTLYNEVLPGVSQAQRRTVGDFGRRGVVPRGLCARPPPPFSAARRFRAQGRRGEEVPRLSRKRWRLRACAVRRRPARHDRMELLVSNRGQSRRGWNP